MLSAIRSRYVTHIVTVRVYVVDHWCTSQPVPAVGNAARSCIFVRSPKQILVETNYVGEQKTEEKID